MLPIVLVATPVFAQEEAADDRWNISAELSFSDQSGNQTIQLFTGGLNLSHLRQDEFELDASYQSRYGRSEGEIVTRNDYASVALDLGPEETVSPFLFADGERDPLRRLALRLSSGGGAKYSPIRSDDGSTEASVSLALLYSHQRVQASAEAPDERTNNARWSVRLRGVRDLGPGISVRHVSYVQPVWDLFADYLLRMETGLRMTLTERLALSATYQLNREARPPAGVEPNDRLFRTGLIFNF